VKLDRALVVDLDRDPSRRALVTSMVLFASEIGASLVAEGVETHDELRALRSLGVELAQGYLIGRPAPLPIAIAKLAPARLPPLPVSVERRMQLELHDGPLQHLSAQSLALQSAATSVTDPAGREALDDALAAGRHAI